MSSDTVQNINISVLGLLNLLTSIRQETFSAGGLADTCPAMSFDVLVSTFECIQHLQCSLEQGLL